MQTAISDCPAQNLPLKVSCSGTDETDHEAFPEDEITNIAHSAMSAVTLIGLDRLPDDRILTKQELAKALACSARTLMRMVERYEIPPAATLGGRRIWIAGKVKTWIVSAAARREAEAEKEALRLRVFLR